MSAQASWWLNQGGIVVEIMGAGYLVWCAWSSKETTRLLETHLDAIQESVNTLLSEVQSNFRNQLKGFIVVAAGLVLQFASNFGGAN